MAYNALVNQPLDAVSTTQAHPLGYQVSAYDPLLGQGAFEYVKGVTSGARGSLVLITKAGVTALTGARSKGRVGVLMAALDATTKFGWAQIAGKSVVAYSSAATDAAQAFLHATAGTVCSTAVAGDAVISATFDGSAADPGTGLAYMRINYPTVADFDGA